MQYTGQAVPLWWLAYSPAPAVSIIGTPLWRSLFFLDRYFPCGVMGRMQEPIPAAHGRRQAAHLQGMMSNDQFLHICISFAIVFTSELRRNLSFRRDEAVRLSAHEATGRICEDETINSATRIRSHLQLLAPDAWALTGPFGARKPLARGFGAQIILPVSDCDKEYFMEMRLCCMQP